MKRRCPTYLPTRWSHSYFLYRWFTNHHQSILNLGFRIPDEIFALGFMIEPLFVLISEFENRKARLFTSERLLAKCLARLRNLVHKYEHIPHLASCSRLLRAMTFLSRSGQNHQLSLMAEALTWQSKVNRPADIELVDETPLFLDGVFAELMSERAVAAAEAEVLDTEMLPEEDLEDDDGFEVQSIFFNEQEHSHVMQALDEQMNAATVQVETTGIFIRLGAT
jgi:hypothetical protein